MARPAGVEGHAGLHPAESGAARRTWLLAWLVVFLAVIPLPVGSNRPAFVALATVAIGLLGTFYWVVRALDRRAGHLRLGLGLMVPTVFGLFCAFLIVQLIPIAGIGFEHALPDGTALQTLSFAPTATFLLLLQVLGYGLFAMLVAHVASRSWGATAFVHACFALTVIYAAVGLVLLTQLGDTYFGIPKEYYLGSATGPFVNRNSFATFLAMGLAAGCVLLCHYLSRRGRGLRALIVVVGLAAIAAALFATNSRMGIFAGLVGSLVALLVGGIKARFRWWAWLLLAAALAASAVVLAPHLGEGVLDRLLEVDGALRQRMELYDQVVTMVAMYPWTGVGAGAFEWAFPVFHAPPLTGAFVWDRAHSTYLTFFAELGLVGGLLPIIIVLVLAVRSVKRGLDATDRWVPGVVAVAVTVVVAVHSLVDFSVEIPANAFFLIAYLVAGATDRSEGRRVA